VLDYGMRRLSSPRERHVLTMILSLTRNVDYFDNSNFTLILTSEKSSFFQGENESKGKTVFQHLWTLWRGCPSFINRVTSCMGKLHSQKFTLF